MAGSAQAKRYAQAVFQIALQNQDFDRWLFDLKILTGLQRDSRFVQVVEQANLRNADKVAVLKDRFPGVSPLAVNLAGLLFERHKIVLLPEIYRELQRLVDEYRGIQRAEVITAVALDEAEKKHLEARLSALTGKVTTIATKIDPSMIGGIVARFDGKLLDASTKSRLEALKKEISQTPR